MLFIRSTVLAILATAATVTMAAPTLENNNIEAREEVLKILQARTTCYTTTKKGGIESCATNECPSSECKVSDKDRCVWTNTSSKRPSGCSKCSCAKHTS